MRASARIRLAAAALAAALGTTASAQATRTWVSGVGDDHNPCSRTAPCTTWAGAIARTAAGGEIDALDPGDFGAVTITKSITLDGGHALAGIAVAGVPAVVVNAGASDVVVLRHLRLHGVAAGAVEAPAGVLFGGGGALRVEATTIAGFTVGIDFRPAGGGTLDALGTEIAACSEAGVKVGSGDASTPGRATLSRVHLTGGDYGLLVTDNGRATVHDGVVSDAAVAALAALPVLAGDADLNVQDVVLAGDALGVAAQAAAPGHAVVRVSRLTSLEGTPAAHLGPNGDIRSFGDNRLRSGPGFTLAVDPPERQVSHGTSAAFTVSATADGISPGAVSLECLGLPAHARCAFSPATISPTGTAASSALTIFTDGSSAAVATPAGAVGSGGGRSSGWPLLLLLALAGALAGLTRRARRLRPVAAGLLALSLSLAVACSGGGGGSSSGGSSSGGSSSGGMGGGVAPGSYTVTVRASAGLAIHEATVSLVVE